MLFLAISLQSDRLFVCASLFGLETSFFFWFSVGKLPVRPATASVLTPQ